MNWSLVSIFIFSLVLSSNSFAENFRLLSIEPKNSVVRESGLWEVRVRFQALDGHHPLELNARITAALPSPNLFMWDVSGSELRPLGNGIYQANLRIPLDKTLHGSAVLRIETLWVEYTLSDQAAFRRDGIIGSERMQNLYVNSSPKTYALYELNGVPPVEVGKAETTTSSGNLSLREGESVEFSLQVRSLRRPHSVVASQQAPIGDWTQLAECVFAQGEFQHLDALLRCSVEDVGPNEFLVKLNVKPGPRYWGPEGKIKSLSLFPVGVSAGEVSSTESQSVGLAPLKAFPKDYQISK